MYKKKKFTCKSCFTAIFEWDDRLAQRLFAIAYSITSLKVFCEMVWESTFPPPLQYPHPTPPPLPPPSTQTRERQAALGQQNRNGFTMYSTRGHRAITNFFFLWRPIDLVKFKNDWTHVVDLFLCKCQYCKTSIQ